MTTFLPKDRDGALLAIKDMLYEQLQILDHMDKTEIERTAPSFDDMLLFHRMFIRNMLDIIERS